MKPVYAKIIHDGKATSYIDDTGLISKVSVSDYDTQDDWVGAMSATIKARGVKKSRILKEAGLLEAFSALRAKETVSFQQAYVSVLYTYFNLVIRGEYGNSKTPICFSHIFHANGNEHSKNVLIRKTNTLYFHRIDPINDALKECDYFLEAEEYLGIKYIIGTNGMFPSIYVEIPHKGSIREIIDRMDKIDGKEIAYKGSIDFGGTLNGDWLVFDYNTEGKDGIYDGRNMSGKWWTKAELENEISSIVSWLLDSISNYDKSNPKKAHRE